MEEMPNLLMRRVGLDDIAHISIDFGYLVRTYRAGDAAVWCRLTSDNVGSGWTPERFAHEIMKAPGFDPRGLFFVTIGARPAGTACAWRAPTPEGEIGRLRLLEVKDEHRGKGIGRFLTMMVLRCLREQGLNCCEARVRENCLAPVKTFLAMGFKPYVTDPADIIRWDAIYGKIGRKESSVV